MCHPEFPERGGHTRIQPLQSVPAALAAMLTLVTLAALAPAAVAQSIWLDRVSPKTMHLEIAKPLYDLGDVETDFLTANWSLTGRFPIGTALHIVGELPYAHIALDDGFEESSNSTVGNLYAGIETHPAGGTGAWLEAGVRVPTASEPDDSFSDDDDAGLATAAGTFVDVDRWEAYGLATDAFIFHTAVHGRTDPVGKIGVDVRLAPNLWFGGDLADGTELFLVFGAQVLYHGTSVRAGAGITGRTLVTEDGGGPPAHQVEAAVDVLSGRVRPGMTLRVPINEDNFFEKDAVIGLSLNVLLD
jgi:hypothetical protein